MPMFNISDVTICEILSGKIPCLVLANHSEDPYVTKKPTCQNQC